MNDGGPAFPQTREIGNFFTGMSLRDYFAGQALRELRMNDSAYDWYKLARRAYEYADAMLLERTK